MLSLPNGISATREGSHIALRATTFGLTYHM